MEMQTHHRYFVQYMLKKGAAPVEQALEYCKNIPGGAIKDLTSLKLVILTINRHISEQHFKICTGRCEVTDQEMFIFTNLKDDEVARSAKTFKPLDLEYFHILMQEVAHDDEHRLKYVAALNITSTLTASYSLSHGEAALKKWIDQGFFLLHDGYVYLGPRTITEFSSYFKNQGYEKCNLCSELVFVGKNCSMCNRTLHSYCLMKYLVSQETCPCCKNPWSEGNVEGELMNQDSEGEEEDD